MTRPNHKLSFEELRDFISVKMKMSHVYQPLLLRTLLEAGGTATLRQIAKAFLDRDQSQINYYESRIKRMPLPVLRRHGIVSSDNDVIRLMSRSLTFEQRAELIAACESRMGEFLVQRGMSTWDYRLIETEPVPGEIRYQVLARANGKCQLCGKSSAEDRIEVDHIVPRSKGGTNDLSNLQALCGECNRGKSNKDDKDFN